MALFMHFPGGKKFYPSVPTLERIAAIKTAITLWNLSDIRATIKEQLSVVVDSYFPENPYFPEDSYFPSQWEKIEEKVRSYAEQLVLPQLPKKELLICINAIGFEILEWEAFHKKTFGETEDYNMSMLNQLCWSAYGSIDVKKTIETLVKDENLSVDLRYKMACTCCLESAITELKDRVSDEAKDLAVKAGAYWMEMHMWNCLVEQINNLEETVQSQNFPILKKCCGIKQHIRDIKRDMRGEYDHLLHISLHNCNQLAVEYLMTKLPFKPDDRHFLENAIEDQHEHIWYNSRFKFQSELLFFLYSQEREEHQPESYNMSGFVMLKCCLNWPWQDLFLPFAHYLQTYIEERSYNYVLTGMVKKPSEGFKDYDYSQLFTKVWKQSLVRHKRYVIHKCEVDDDNLLTYLIQIGDKENIKLIWKDASLESQKKIIAFCRKEIATISGNPVFYCNEEDIIKKSMWENLLLFLSELCCEGETKRKIDQQTDGNPCKKVRAMVP